MSTMDNSNLDPVHGLFMEMSLLDSKMQTLQSRIDCVKKDNQLHQKIIAEETSSIDKIEKYIDELSAKEFKMIANIDNLRKTKTIIQEMESSLKQEIARFKEKSMANKIEERKILETYGKMADEYHTIYCSLPIAKERQDLSIEKMRKRIELMRLKQEYNDYMKKLKQFQLITDERVRVTIVAFVKLLSERAHEKELTERNLIYEREIKEEILQLEQKKKDLKENLANKAKVVVDKIKERTANNQSRYGAMKITSFMKTVTPTISIKERLGLIKPVLNFSRTEPQQLTVQKSCAIDETVKEPTVAKIVETAIEPVQKIPSLEVSNAPNAGNVSHSLIENMRNVKIGIKRTTNISRLVKNDKEVMKIRRVTFNLSGPGENEKSISRTPLAEITNVTNQTLNETPAVVLTSETHGVEVEPELKRIATDVSLAPEPDMNSSQDTEISSVLLEKPNMPDYESRDLQSPDFIETEEIDEAREMSTPQINKYFTSPQFNTQEKLVQPFAETPSVSSGEEQDLYSFPISATKPQRPLTSFTQGITASSETENQDVYNFPISSAKPQRPLPSFSQGITAPSGNGNEGLESFFGGPSSSTGNSNTKNFFELF